jgi:glutaredoxin
MSNIIFSATGCARCAITKRYMKEHAIDYREYDIKTDGKDEFAKFYREHRKAIFRDKDGVEFPVFTDGTVIRQGVSVVIAYLLCGEALDGFIHRSVMHGEWLDGFDVSGGNAERTDDLIRVMTYLKQNGLKLQLTTDGHNAGVLEKLLAVGLGNRVIMAVKGPPALYAAFTGRTLDEEALKKSIALTARFPEYRFHTEVAPLVRSDESVSYLTPEEVGQTAALIEAATGSKKHPYELRSVDLRDCSDDNLKSLGPLPESAMFKYRTAARRFQVMAEISKETP